MQRIRIPDPDRWRPRDYQMPLWAYLERGGLRADVAAHRRWGKDDVALNWTARACHQRIGNYWHLLPEAAQARKAIWDAINPHTGRRRIDEAFPVELRSVTRENEMMIRFKCGSAWQVIGSDNYNSLVGSPPIGITFSEWQLARPEAWTYLRPILAENGGWALFLWTSRGRNHAVRSFEARERDKANWFTQRSTALETSVFTVEQLDRERQELIDEAGSEEEGDAKFRQEYLVDFDAAVPGSYFGTQLAKAQDEGRIGAFGHVRSLKVDTAWDIGVDDYTAIWFLQDNGRRVRAIDYFETAGEGPEAIIRAALPELIPDQDERAERLAELGRAVPYEYRNHFLPHDVMVREWGAGAKTRFQTLTALGLKPIRVGVAQNPVERINAARRLMPVVSWDARRCAAGLDHLRNYRKRWNKALGVFGEPLHDEHSHGCLVAGSLVLLADGTQRSVEQVGRGDFVWTPSGNCKVTHSGYIKTSETLVDILTCDGKTLTCTPEHKLLTTAGFFEAGNLSPSMTILTGREWRCHLIGWLSAVTGIGFRAIITGERPTAATTFSASWPQTTSAHTRKRWSPLESFSRPVNSRGSERPSGTGAQRGGHGIASTASPRGSVANRLRSAVRTAATSIARLILAAPSSVRGSARIRRVSARRAALSVFDLTVAGAASYQANGLWVSNSDAFGEYAVNSRVAPKVKPANDAPKDLWSSDDEGEGTEWKAA